ncbi:MAG: hypothetical protein JXR69_07720 [Candidatus Delongbacteria bacterium]|nr:hypothetical protein [Candidatus Delongbacteria bacterium]
MKNTNEKNIERCNPEKMTEQSKRVEAIRVDMRYQMRRMSDRVKRQRMLLF